MISVLDADDFPPCTSLWRFILHAGSYTCTHTHTLRISYHRHTDSRSHPLIPCLSYCYCCGLQRLWHTQDLTCLPGVCVRAGIDCMYCMCAFHACVEWKVYLCFVCVYVCVCLRVRFPYKLVGVRGEGGQGIGNNTRVHIRTTLTHTWVGRG